MWYPAALMCWIPFISQVHGAGGHRLPRRNPSIRLHFHRDVRPCSDADGVVCCRVLFEAFLTCLLCSFFRYFIFTSFWAYKIYYVYGFMMLVLVILCIVTVCVTIVCTYFLLNAEDYRWWVLFCLVFNTPQPWIEVIIIPLIVWRVAKWKCFSM